MITTSKDGFWWQVDAEILNSLERLLKLDVDFKREALKKIDSACFVGGCQYVAAADLLDEDEVAWKIWLAFTMR